MISNMPKIVESPAWYVEPFEYPLPVKKIDVGLWDEEASVIVESQGEEISALVPRWAVDEENRTVACVAKGESHDRQWVMVVTPPASFGSTCVLWPRQELALST